MTFEPIATISTPFPEKFGIPRQPGLVAQAEGVVKLLPPYNQTGVFDGIEESSHLWLTFVFHHQPQEWSPKVRPPRLGGNIKRGVFATRSPRRPNPIGLSAVRLLSVDHHEFTLRVAGVDLMDSTPILDIKPYIPFSDCLPEATHDFAEPNAFKLPVRFTPECLANLPQDQDWLVLLTKVLELDCRPAYHQDQRPYGMRLMDYNVTWRIDGGDVLVVSVEKV